MSTRDMRRLLETLALFPHDALLEPVWNASSPRGYYYSGAPSLDREALVADLESLVDDGYAERVFVDTLSLCPNCESHALNVHEICPSCASSHLEQFKAFFHFRCGYVGPETAFRKERDGLRCPKCNRILADLGTDHDSPGQYFRCLACTAMFQVPDVGARCLSCACRFDQTGMQDIHRHDVFAYRITDLGKARSSAGVLRAADGEP